MDLQRFYGLIFMDVRDCAHYTLYIHAYFANISFWDNCFSAKIGPLKNFPLHNIMYGTHFYTLALQPGLPWPLVILISPPPPQAT